MEREIFGGWRIIFLLAVVTLQPFAILFRRAPADSFSGCIEGRGGEGKKGEGFRIGIAGMTG